MSVSLDIVSRRVIKDFVVVQPTGTTDRRSSRISCAFGCRERGDADVIAAANTRHADHESDPKDPP